MFLTLVITAAMFGAVAEADHGSSPIGDPFTARVNLVAEGFTSPVHLTEAPDNTGRLFVVDQAGLIRIITPGGQLLAEPFLDVRDRMVALNPGFDERGLLGLAFHPGYATNGRFFVYYSAPLRDGAPAGFNHTSHISEFQVSPDPNRADPTSERILLQVDEPQGNHNAGSLTFGPHDGNLYIALGDGGGANDNQLGHVEDWYDFNEGGNGQDVTDNLLGSILRIDVDSGDPYGIPADNPFVGRDGLDEIYAYGLRNPYRISFDMGGNRELFAADVGQALREEVSIVVSGGNFGWNVKEGTQCFNTADNSVPQPSCPDVEPNGTPLIDPIIEFVNANQPDGLGLAVIGGHVYRGSALPALAGQYVFGSWSTSFAQPDGMIFAATPKEVGLWDFNELTVTTSPDGRIGRFVLGFGQDLQGEMYVLTTDNAGPTGTTGMVFRIVPAP
jgi:glucose/arabinose dehydrogenase